MTSLELAVTAIAGTTPIRGLSRIRTESNLSIGNDRVSTKRTISANGAFGASPTMDDLPLGRLVQPVGYDSLCDFHV